MTGGGEARSRSLTVLLRNLRLKSFSSGLVEDCVRSERADKCSAPSRCSGGGGRTGAGRSSLGRGPRGDPTCRFIPDHPYRQCQLRRVDTDAVSDVRPPSMSCPTSKRAAYSSERRRGRTVRCWSTLWIAGTSVCSRLIASMERLMGRCRCRWPRTRSHEIGPPGWVPWTYSLLGAEWGKSEVRGQE